MPPLAFAATHPGASGSRSLHALGALRSPHPTPKACGLGSGAESDCCSVLCGAVAGPGARAGVERVGVCRRGRAGRGARRVASRPPVAKVPDRIRERRRRVHRNC